jgi:hypothetical protein
LTPTSAEDVNAIFRTAVPRIYSAADVIGFPALAATFMGQGRLAAAHMFGVQFRRKAKKTVFLTAFSSAASNQSSNSSRLLARNRLTPAKNSIPKLALEGYPSILADTPPVRHLRFEAPLSWRS